VLSLVLEGLSETIPYDLISIDGGLKDNAIPREAHAELLFREGMEHGAKKICKACEAILKQQYQAADPNLRIHLQLEETGKAAVFTEETKLHAQKLLLGMPDGVICMSGDIPGLVQTSLNLGIVKTEEQKLLFCQAVRSSVGTEKKALLDRLRQIVEQEGATMQVSGDYPAWEYRKDSPLREDCVRIFEELFGRKPKVEAIHAGLECGLLASKIPDLDCVSMGPDILNIHTTEERISISSVERIWNYILEIVKRK
jgi:dipeptidase D